MEVFYSFHRSTPRPHTHTNTHTFTDTYSHIQTYAHIYKITYSFYILTYTHIHSNMLTHIHTYTLTYISHAQTYITHTAIPGALRARSAVHTPKTRYRYIDFSSAQWGAPVSVYILILKLSFFSHTAPPNIPRPPKCTQRLVF